MNSKILFVATYPPRECGIATFTQSLCVAINNQLDDSIETVICALEDGLQGFGYPQEVKYVLDATQSDQYGQIAKEINADHQVKAVMVEHEFGLYAGHYGDYLLEMLNVLEKPMFITFHTVLPKPDAKRLQIVKTIADFMTKILVMTSYSKEILINDYGILADKIVIVPHGTYLVLWKRKEKANGKIGNGHRPTLTTFGLLGRNKSIETAIAALPEIKEYFPDVLYLILGKTHPGLVKHEGEKYRDFLVEMVRQLNLEENIQFINRFLELDELLDYLSVTDIYLFTSKDPDQAVSGTFAYAMSSACPIIATPIPHAKELLTEDSGILVDFEQPQQIARAVIRLLQDKNLRNRISRQAFQKTRFTIWENVANKTMEIFRPFIEHSNFRYRIPPINLQHIEHMTTERGIIQFSDFDVADIESGYTLDDNARALIALSWHYESFKEASSLKLIEIYLDYVIYCQRPDGSFINYVEKDGSASIRNRVENTEDAYGRAIWALGYFLSKNLFGDPLVDKAEKCIQKALENIQDINSPRAMATSIKGLYYYNQKRDDKKLVELINIFADRIIAGFNSVADKKWCWFEEYLTYANAILPEAILYAWKATGNINYHIIAKSTFDFLLSKIFKGNRIQVISNSGWLHKKRKYQGSYGEQPVDVAYTIMALDLFYSDLCEPQYLVKLNTAFDWFMGLNHLNEIIYNPVTGGCYDGLEKECVNLNQGAESSITYLLARLTMEKYNNRDKKRKTSDPIYHRDQFENLINNKQKKNGKDR